MHVEQLRHDTYEELAKSAVSRVYNMIHVEGTANPAYLSELAEANDMARAQSAVNNVIDQWERANGKIPVAEELDDKTIKAITMELKQKIREVLSSQNPNISAVRLLSDYIEALEYTRR